MQDGSMVNFLNRKTTVILPEIDGKIGFFRAMLAVGSEAFRASCRSGPNQLRQPGRSALCESEEAYRLRP
jgi:hypothetical protein